MAKLDYIGLCPKCGGAITRDARGKVSCEECEREDDYEKAQKIDKEEEEEE